MAGFPAGAVVGGLLGAHQTWFGRTEDLLLATALAQAAFATLVWRPAGGTPGSSARLAPDRHRMGLQMVRMTAPPSRVCSRKPVRGAHPRLSGPVGPAASSLTFWSTTARSRSSRTPRTLILAGYTAVMNAVSIAFLFVLAGPLLRRGLRLGIAANPLVPCLRCRHGRGPRGGGISWRSLRPCRRPASPTSP